MASKGLGSLPSKKESVMGHGCGREGGGALPLPRAAAVSTGLRVRGGAHPRGETREARGELAAHAEVADLGLAAAVEQQVARLDVSVHLLRGRGRGRGEGEGCGGAGERVREGVRGGGRGGWGRGGR